MPVLWCHGDPGSRFEPAPYGHAAATVHDLLGGDGSRVLEGELGQGFAPSDLALHPELGHLSIMTKILPTLSDMRAR